MTGKTHDLKDKVNLYCIDHCSPMHPDEQALYNKSLKLPDCIMLGSYDEIRFLASLCRAMGAKKTIDVGVYTGFSALCVARVLPEDGTVIACDITDEFYEEFCEPAWTSAGVLNKIDFRVAPAVQTLQSLIADGQAGTFDFAFIDANKTDYRNYYELCLQLVRSGGIVAVDNTLFSGRIMSDSKNPCDVAIRELNEFMKTDDRVDVTMLVLGDGTAIAVKK